MSSSLPIIWISPECSPSEQWANYFSNQHIEFSKFEDFVTNSEAQNQFPIMIFGPFQNFEESTYSVKKFIAAHDEDSILFLSSSNTVNDMIEMSNLESVYRVVSDKMTESEIKSIFLNFIEKNNIKLERKSLYKRLKEKNSQLDSINLNLKALVKERTIDLEEAREEAAIQSLKLKNLVSFINQVSQKVDFESILSFVNQEVRKYESVGSPLLIYQLSEQTPKILSFQGHQVVTHACIEKDILSELKKTKSEESYQLILANELGRPFGKLLPITLLLNKKNFLNDVGALLLFEHSLLGDQLSDFMEFLTERLQAFSIAIEKLLLEEDLTLISKFWEATFDSVNSPVAIINTNFEVLRANTHFNKFKDKKPLKCYEYFQNKNEICTQCPFIQETLPGKEPLIQRGENLYQLFSYPIRLEHQGKVNTFVHYYLDITRARVLQSRVIQNEKIAAIGHLAGNIAHELNNPLTGIKALAEVILSEVKEENSLHSDLMEIKKASVRCHKIINNLLNFTKEDENKIENVSLTDLVSTTLPLIKTIISEHNVEIDLSTNMGFIHVSSSLVQQVIFNLIKNACESISEPPGEIKIQTYKDNDKCVFQVSDSGEGISEETLKTLFDPFFTTKKEGEGTGLGLYISKNIIEKFNGSIEVISEISKGSAFKVMFQCFERQSEI